MTGARWGLALWLVALLAGAAHAHRLYAEVRLEAGEIVLELVFGDGVTPEGAEVVVLEGDREVGRGRTDAQGVFRFRPPRAGLYRLRAREAGLHEASAEIRVDDVPDSAGLTAPVSTAGESTTPVRSRTKTDAVAPSPPAAGAGLPWKGVVLGLVIIAILAGALHLVQRRGRT
jgi:hypothetical protein